MVYVIVELGMFYFYFIRRCCIFIWEVLGFSRGGMGNFGFWLGEFSGFRSRFVFGIR